MPKELLDKEKVMLILDMGIQSAYDTLPENEAEENMQEAILGVLNFLKEVIPVMCAA